MHTRKQIDGRVLPQPCPLESMSADNPRVGTKRGIDNRKTGNTSIRTIASNGNGGPDGKGQHRRGESSNNTAVTGKGGSTVDAGQVRKRQPLVPVLGRDKKPLDPTTPARARRLLATDRAVVARAIPFTIRLKDRTSTDGVTVVSELGVGIDPGSKNTGIALYRESERLDKSTGEILSSREGLAAMVIIHRGSVIKKKLSQRANYRRRRRTSNLRYRARRFNNRAKPKGWLPPSLQHRVDTTLSMLSLLRKLYTISSVAFEYTKFDTQAMVNPEMSGIQYQQGTLFGYELREYLLEKYQRTCVYCGAKNTPLNIDHVVPRANGGSNAASNLVLSCIPCNQEKGKQSIEVFVTDKTVLAKIKSQLKKPLRDAAITQAARNAVLKGLRSTGLRVSTGTGGRTKYNRSRNSLPKTHAIDALCIGTVDIITGYTPQEITARHMGRGQYQRTKPDKYGFPRLRFTRQKQFFGYCTGDIARATVPTGKNAGTHQGRIAVRSSGRFKVDTIPSINYKYLTLIQRNTGWDYNQ